MVSIPGRPTICCEGWRRREWLGAGSVSALGLTLPQLLNRSARAGRVDDSPTIGRARNCILLFLFGAPAHQDIWDLKPDAPADFRGEFRPTATSVPGMVIGEHIPQLAMLARRFALVRSVTHTDDTHTIAMHYMLTGARHMRPNTNPENAADDFPCFGSVVQYAERNARTQKNRGRISDAGRLVSSVSLNAPANQVSANNHVFPGFFAGFLGSAYDPLFISQNSDAADFQPLPRNRAGDRLTDQRRLLGQFDAATRRIDRLAASTVLESHYQRAFDLLTSTTARTAFDLTKEPHAVRRRYGMTPFGQGCLLARRLIEAGVRLVTVNWERDDAFWDTHKNNFSDLRNKLLPNFDRGASALLEDLSDRGLLDDTLVVALGEFGRTPRINGQAGRDHWAACNSILLAGAGIPGGQVYGASDRLAAYPQRDPVRPEDLAATIYHLLGIDAAALLSDPQGRKVAISTGSVLTRLIGGSTT